MKKYIFGLCLLTLLLALAQPAQPVQAQENDPVTQCGRGVDLFLEGNQTEAYPLLEAGFNGRAAATFTDPNDLGICGAALGLLRDNRGDREGALEAYTVSLEIFRQTGEHSLEGITLNNIASVYHARGNYETALFIFKEALVIHRKTGNLAEEAAVLNNIAGVYDAQRKYEEALDTFKAALVIFSEIGELNGKVATLNNIAEIYRTQGQYNVALSKFEEALTISRAINNRAAEGTIL